MCVFGLWRDSVLNRAYLVLLLSGRRVRIRRLDAIGGLFDDNCEMLTWT
jgi:hypothetical protein